MVRLRATTPPSVKRVLARLRVEGNPAAVAGMARFGIATAKAFGLTTPQLRKIAREIGKDHDLANQLWKSQIHEGRHLAVMVERPELVTEAQMERWARDFDSWDIVDSCCRYLFLYTPFAWKKAVEWSRREEEFEKRAAFSLMAYLAVHDKQARDEKFVSLLKLIQRQATDERNFVKKAVNWALRQIGKRNRALNEQAIMTARAIQSLESKAARWVASDALRELTSTAVQRKLAR